MKVILYSKRQLTGSQWSCASRSSACVRLGFCNTKRARLFCSVHVAIWLYQLSLFCRGWSCNNPSESQPHLYLLNQLRKQGLSVSGLIQVFMTLVVARFQYALPALADQLSADYLHNVDAVFSKARRWRWLLTSHIQNSADLIEQCDKHLFRAALKPTHCMHSMLPRVPLNPTHCLHSMLPPKKNMYERNLRKKDRRRELPLAKIKLYKDSF